MALPFGPYEGQDLTEYEAGNKFLPRQFYSLGFPNTPPPSIADASTGITNTQAAYPYKWPLQGGGGGGGGNPFGPDAITKDFDVRSWQELEGPNQHGKMGWVDDTVTGYQTPSGWKTAKDKNIFHAGLFTGDPKQGDIEETEIDWSKFPSPVGIITKGIRRWKEKRDVRRAEEQQAVADQMRQERAASASHAAAQGRYDASVASGREAGGWYGGADYSGGKSGAVAQAGPGRDPDDRMAQGGRIGLYAGGDPEEPAEDTHEIMRGENIPFSELEEGEGDILSMLVAKYIEAGFPPDQAEEMAMQELQQMSAEPGQGEGIARLV